MILIVGTSEKGPLTFGNPHLPPKNKKTWALSLFFLVPVGFVKGGGLKVMYANRVYCNMAYYDIINYNMVYHNMA